MTDNFDVQPPENITIHRRRHEKQPRRGDRSPMNDPSPNPEEKGTRATETGATGTGVIQTGAKDTYGARFAKWQSLPDVFFDKANELGDKPLFYAKSGDTWAATSWRETADQVRKLSAGLLKLGVAPGDRVVLVSENRPEWCIADLAIMSAGAFTVPAYTTNGVSDHIHVLEDCGAKLAIVSTSRLADPLIGAARALDAVRDVIYIESPDTHAAPEDAILHDWHDIIADEDGDLSVIKKIIGGLRRDQTSCLIYTSGTGGAPKGVMLSHGAILHNCAGAYDVLIASGMAQIDKETFLSFLPLSHSYEHTAGFWFPVSIGAEIYFAENIDKLVGNMAETKPTIMTAVPRLYEAMHARIMSGVQRQGGFKEKLFLRTIALGSKAYIDGKGSLTLGERIVNRLLDFMVRRKVAGRFGGQLKAFVSGGAPLNFDIGVFFTSLGIRVLQGYGQTETAPVVSVNPFADNRIHTVGKPMIGVEVKILEDGEIVVRGELIMQGYWNDPQSTAGALRDGWIHTGDVGEIDEDGYLRITDRKKDIIVNSGGDNISPQRVEGILCFEAEIEQAMVYGDRHPWLAALLVPNDDFMRNWAKENGKSNDLAELANDPEFLSALRPAIDRANEKLTQIEQIRRILISSMPFTTDNSMMTPSLKIRRHVISDQYGGQLEALYAKPRKGG
jgi:long-chain acyl-CoA synthetase